VEISTHQTRAQLNEILAFVECLEKAGLNRSLQQRIRTKPSLRDSIVALVLADIPDKPNVDMTPPPAEVIEQRFKKLLIEARKRWQDNRAPLIIALNRVIEQHGPAIVEHTQATSAFDALRVRLSRRLEYQFGLICAQPLSAATQAALFDSTAERVRKDNAEALRRVARLLDKLNYGPSSQQLNLLVEQQLISEEYAERVKQQLIADAQAQNAAAVEARKATGQALPIEELDLTVRTYNVLKRVSVHTCEDAVRLTDDQLRNIPNMGDRSIVEILTRLRQHGYTPVSTLDFEIALQ